MANRPELVAPPEIFYDDTGARKYTSSSRIIKIQAKLSERALELLALPKDGVPRFLLDIDVAVEREVEGDLLLGDMGQGLGLRSGVIDGAISISAVQWLWNADKSSHEPHLRLKAFFMSLYRCLSRGARAVLQVYPENEAQNLLILGQALEAGFGGGMLTDYPECPKKRKKFLVLTCGPVQTSKSEYGESDNGADNEENGMVFVSDRNRPRKRQRTNKNCKEKEWVLKKKEQSRRKGNDVPPDSKYTARKRKSCF